MTVLDKKIAVLGAIGLHMEYSNGAMGLTISGDGYDIAQAIAAIPEACVFGSAVHQGAFVEFLMMDAEESSIVLRLDEDPNFSFSGSIGVIDRDVVEKKGVSPVFLHGIKNETLVKCLEQVRGAVIEAAFASEHLAVMLEMSAHRETPVFLIARSIDQVKSCYAIEKSTNVRMISRVPANEILELEAVCKPLSLSGRVNFSPCGKVHVFADGEWKLAIDFEMMVYEQTFAYLCAALVNQVLAWRRPIEKAVVDCRLAMLERVKSGIFWVSSDSIDRKFSRYARRVKNLEHDFLTGLKTRGTTDQEIEKLLIESKPFSIFMVDIDHFKSVNDTWGHDTGDTVLAAVAREISKGVRASDISGRWGGEEFIVIMKDATLEVAWNTAERIRKRISELENMPRQITASFGLAEHKLGRELQETINRADKGLYKAKRNGRNQVVLYVPGDEEEKENEGHTA